MRWLVLLALLPGWAAWAQTTRLETAPTPQPVLTVTATATSSVPNDRMHAWLRAEADSPDPAFAASEVNARIGRALSRARATRGVEASSSGYSTYQVAEKDRPSRWRVVQSIALESSDFLTLVGLVSRLQAEDKLRLSGLNFSVSPPLQRSAEDALIQPAIKAWPERADLASRGFGGTAWRPGRITVQGADFGRPQPMMRAQSMGVAAAAPVSVEGGTSDVAVTVSGEVILETVRPPTR